MFEAFADRGSRSAAPCFSEDAVTLRSLDCYSLDTERTSCIAVGFVGDQLVDVSLDMLMMLLFEMISGMACWSVKSEG
jgi:hypothetical protein